jgi:predicted RNA methylase
MNSNLPEEIFYDGFIWEKDKNADYWKIGTTEKRIGNNLDERQVKSLLKENKAQLFKEKSGLNDIRQEKKSTKEIQFELPFASTQEQLSNNIDIILSGYSKNSESSKMALLQVLEYVNEKGELGKEYLKENNITNKDQFDKLLTNKHANLRKPIEAINKQEAKAIKDEIFLEKIFDMATKAEEQMQEAIKKTEQSEGSDFMKNYSENRQALDEFFTPIWVARIMYKLAIMHGFNGEGNVLEPSFGHGVFFDVLKENLIPEKNMWGFELYKPNFDFVKEAYPDAHLINRQFEYEFAKNFKALNRDGIYKNELFSEEEFALVIGNPPYGSHKSEYDYLFDKDAQIRIEGFFIYLALQKLKKGGLLIFIINSLWMHNDNKYNKQKQLIYQLGELIDAYRLPNNVFKGENRDTSIASDIVIFRKK